MQRTLSIAVTMQLILFVWLARTGLPAESEKTTYDDHIRPIFRQYCLVCHRGDGKKGGLALDTYAATMEGGASGEVVYAADLDSSRLWDLVSHADEPAMPPNSDKLPDAKLDLIQRWIEGRTLENSGSVAKAPKKSGLAMLAPTTGGKPDGPAAIPESLYREPIVHSRRAAAVTALAASPWAPLVAVAGQRQVSLYHSQSGTLLGIIPFLEGTPHVLQFSRDGDLLLIAGGRGASIGLAALVDVRSGSRLVTVGDEFDAVLAADVNPNRTLVALGGPQRVVRVFTVTDGSLAYEIHKHTDWITAIAFSPNGELLFTADRGGGAYLWEAETGREIASLQGHKEAITSAAWRPDSRVVATASEDGTVRLWEPDEGRQIKNWTAHGGGTMAVRFAADGRLATAGRDHKAKLWKSDGGRLKDLASFADLALTICVTHDGTRVAAGDFAGDVRLVDIDTAQPIAALPPNPPTLAMRTAACDSAAQQAVDALNVALRSKLAADQALATSKTELEQRLTRLADMQGKLADVQAARDAAAKETEIEQQAVATLDQQAQEIAETRSTADAAVKAALAELVKAKEIQGDTAAAEQKLAEATATAKQAAAAAAANKAATARADQAHLAAAKRLETKNNALATAQQNVQKAQAAGAHVTEQITAAERTVAVKTDEVVSKQHAVEATRQAVEATQAEQAAFAEAALQLDTAIDAADSRLAAAAEHTAITQQAREQAAAELDARKTAADEAAKKLAAAKAEYDRLKKIEQNSQTALLEKTQAANTAALAQNQAEATAAQSRADRELFEKTQEVRQAYRK